MLTPGNRGTARRPNRTAHRTDRPLTLACTHRNFSALEMLRQPVDSAQYTSIDYGQVARANGVVLSVGMAGQCWDNAVAESFFATIKRELIDTRAWPTRAGLRTAIFDWIEGWYNTRRLHSSLGYLSPAEYETTIHHNADRRAA